MTGRLHSLRRLGTAAICALLLLVQAPYGSVCRTLPGAAGAHAVGVKAIAATVAIGPRIFVGAPTSPVVADAARYRLQSTNLQFGGAETEAFFASALGSPATRPRAPPVF